jgi:hypothetical protein
VEEVSTLGETKSAFFCNLPAALWRPGDRQARRRGRSLLAFFVAAPAIVFASDKVTFLSPGDRGRAAVSFPTLTDVRTPAPSKLAQGFPLTE